MGFLSGVLGAVKNENEVTTYDNYITGEDKKLNKVIEKLNKNIGSGRAGLVESVAAVKGWLEGYGKSVKEKTENIYIQMKMIMNNIDTHKTYIDNTTKDGFDAISSNLSGSITINKRLLAKLQNDGEIIKLIDVPLQKKTAPAIEKIFQAFSELKKLAKNDDIRKTFLKTQQEHHELCRSIHKELHENADKKAVEFVGDIQSEIKELESKMKNLDQGLSESEKQLMRLISIADDAVRHARDNDLNMDSLDALIRGKLTKQIKDINSELLEFENNFRINVQRPLDSAVSLVYTSITELYKKIDNVGGATLADSEHKTVDELIAYIKKQVFTIKNSVLGGDNAKSSVEHHWKDFKSGVENLVKELNGTDVADPGPRRTGLLRDILDGVLKYAKRFSERGNEEEYFEKTVEEWVVNILTDNEFVRQKFKAYLKGNSKLHSQYKSADSSDELNDEGIAKIAQQIVANLKVGIIDDAVKDFKSTIDSVRLDHNDKIQKYVSAVQIVCQQFSGGIDLQMDRHKKGEINFDGAIAAIDRVVLKNPASPSAAMAKGYLEEAYKRIMYVLSTTADQVASELQQFVNKSSLDTAVEAAIGKVAGMATLLRSDPVTGALDYLKKPISNLHGNLENATGQLSTGGRTAGDSTNYAKNVDTRLKEVQSQTQALLSGMKIQRMALDAAIKGVDEPLAAITVLANQLNAKDNGIEKTVKYLEMFLKTLGQNNEEGSLRMSIKKCINANHSALSYLRKQVKQAVEAAKASIIEYIQTTSEELIKRINSATDAMKTEAHSLYANRRKNELQDLKDVVELRLGEIKGIIYLDSISGHKALLKRVKGDLDDFGKLVRRQDNKLDALQNKESVEELSQAFRAYVDPILFHVADEIRKLFESEGPHNIYHMKLETAYEKLKLVLAHLKNNSNRKFTFDSRFSELLDQLQNLLGDFNPSTSFSEISMPLLDAVKHGLTSFSSELTKAYVSPYSGQNINWAVGLDSVLSGQPKKCAQILCTLVPILLEDLSELSENCDGRWKGKMINLSIESTKYNTVNGLGGFFANRGYDVSRSDKQEGELRNKDGCKGEHIQRWIAGTVVSQSGNRNLIDDLKCIFAHLETYNQVCHMATQFSTKYPCSVYEMLMWLCGLPYNAVRSDLLREGIGNLLENPDKKLANVDGIALYDHESSYLDAYPSKITYRNLDAVLHHVCEKAYDVLTHVVGFGDEFTVYACEFSTNSLHLMYPTDPSQCLDMLLDILRRLFRALRFLRSRCKVPAEHYGWRDCRYGRDVFTSKSHCNNQSTGKAACHPTCEATCKPNCRVHASVSCQPNSPLMSYLNDCLPGHLPHRLQSVGCKPKCNTCSASSTKSMPCLTPLGFRAFSGCTKSGEDLCKIIETFMNIDDIDALFALTPSPPSTLPEHYAFTLSFVDGWETNNKHSFLELMRTSLTEQSIKLYKNTDDLTDLLRQTYGNTPSDHGKTYKDGDKIDLSCFSLTTICSNKQHCAPYVSNLCCDVYGHFAHKHSNLYMSWAIYLTWDFWNCLNNLYNDFIQIFCLDWGCQMCLNGNSCKPGKHGMPNPKGPGSGCLCPSLVGCRGVWPTLYNYGLTFQNVKTLITMKKKCIDMRSQLYDVLHSDYFKNLFTECDNFLYQIRLPFMTLTLALWLLSLLYLLHIMVIRLDLLHIKSHLHSPSTHRIAAQSLLAAARVSKLNRVFYLQP
ncbi:hypothetical protein, conserved [Babesia bigemina]|uniref:C3H1-type domain-containing protein n=2 Tax=Babesia bigemina TaxID=5866 RepID=A0A061BJI4_BABBI|nr:hypothetical protein, conserved [Babesia bigemina]CDR71654.1 hypothetical protein, conserved [Babesia bigemina]|eukprot:XP_012770601.1 hypothetical protein, conserved [Babesia bigemina]